MTRELLPEAIRQESFSEELKEDHWRWTVVRKGKQEPEIMFEEKARTISCRASWVMAKS